MMWTKLWRSFGPTFPFRSARSSIHGSGTVSTVALLTGPTFLVERTFGIDAGVITPLRGDLPNAIYAGLVWNVGKIR